MPKTNYIATDANGVVHTRSTASRAYTHTVVVQSSKAGAIARAKEHAEINRRSLTKLVASVAAGQDAYVDAGVREHRILGRDYFMHRFMEDAAKIAAFRGGSIDGEVAALLAERLAYLDQIDWTVWRNVGWCGRRDLAEKVAAQHRTGNYGAVAILPAVEQVKAAKAKTAVAAQ